MFICKSKKLLKEYYSNLFPWLERCEKLFGFKDLKGFDNIKLDGVKFTKSDSQIIASYDKNKFKFDQIINVVKNSAEIHDISTDDGDLEDIFLQITNK